MSSRRDAEFTEYAQARLSWLRGLAYVLRPDQALPPITTGKMPVGIAITP